jgi:hypothetical protein
MADDKQYSDYRPNPSVPRDRPGLEVIQRQADQAGVSAILQSLQNDLAAAFHDMTVGPDERLTFYRRSNPANYVPLIRVHIAPGVLSLDLDPVVVLRWMKIPETELDDLLAVLPADRTDLGGRRLRVPFASPAEVQRLAGYLVVRAKP